MRLKSHSRSYNRWKLLLGDLNECRIQSCVRYCHPCSTKESLESLWCLEIAPYDFNALRIQSYAYCSTNEGVWESSEIIAMNTKSNCMIRIASFTRLRSHLSDYDMWKLLLSDFNHHQIHLKAENLQKMIPPLWKQKLPLHRTYRMIIMKRAYPYKTTLTVAWQTIKNIAWLHRNFRA